MAWMGGDDYYLGSPVARHELTASRRETGFEELVPTGPSWVGVDRETGALDASVPLRGAVRHDACWPHVARWVTSSGNDLELAAVTALERLRQEERHLLADNTAKWAWEHAQIGERLRALDGEIQAADSDEYLFEIALEGSRTRLAGDLRCLFGAMTGGGYLDGEALELAITELDLEVAELLSSVDWAPWETLADRAPPGHKPTFLLPDEARARQWELVRANIFDEATWRDAGLLWEETAP